MCYSFKGGVLNWISISYLSLVVYGGWWIDGFCCVSFYVFVLDCEGQNHGSC
jgi:hypothetical protein